MNPAPMPVISALYVALAALLMLVLALRVSQLRRLHGVGIGDGGQGALARAIRAHANLAEWGWPVLLLLLVAELNRAPLLLLHAAGIAFIVGRVLHAVGLSGSAGYSFGRFTGIALTWLALVVLAAWALWAFVRIGLR